MKYSSALYNNRKTTYHIIYKNQNKKIQKGCVVWTRITPSFRTKKDFQWRIHTDRAVRVIQTATRLYPCICMFFLERNKPKTKQMRKKKSFTGDLWSIYDSGPSPSPSRGLSCGLSRGPSRVHAPSLGLSGHPEACRVPSVAPALSDGFCGHSLPLEYASGSRPRAYRNHAD